MSGFERSPRKNMRINEHCAACLLDKQRQKTDDPEYLGFVTRILAERKESDTAPYMVYLFNKAYEQRFGRAEPYRDIKRRYNDLALSLEEDIRLRIEAADDPLAASIAFARTGNYIDFGAMNHVDKSTFLALLDHSRLTERDLPAYEAFAGACRSAKRFLLIADNCGEIVFDRLFLEQLQGRYPQMKLSVLVRGEEVLNDVTQEDARYVRIDELAEIVSNGSSVAGTIYEMLPDCAKEAIDQADVILAKGQGNYESLCGQGFPVFYSLLCKCDLFTDRFRVPRLTGIFVEEK